MNIPKLELVHPYKRRWEVRWEVIDNEKEFSCKSKEFIGKPSLDTIKKTIFDWYNQQADQKILSTFVWNDYPVWLSTENQFNYKAEYDLAVQTNGQSLPTKFKFGIVDNPRYHTFETVDELTDFYVNMVKHIRSVLEEYWAKKDAIDWQEYEV